jgi:hypothetical protein
MLTRLDTRGDPALNSGSQEMPRRWNSAKPNGDSEAACSRNHHAEPDWLMPSLSATGEHRRDDERDLKKSRKKARRRWDGADDDQEADLPPGSPAHVLDPAPHRPGRPAIAARVYQMNTTIAVIRIAGFAPL